MQAAVVEVVGQSGTVDIHRLAPTDGTGDLLATVACINATDTPLVDTRFEVGPFNVDVDGVRHPYSGQQDGVLFSVRTVIVAVRTIHSVVRQGAVAFRHHQRLARSTRIEARGCHGVVFALHILTELADNRGTCALCDRSVTRISSCAEDH